MTDQVALVTGASRGIGQAIARVLAEAGNTVVGTATSASGAESITETLSAINAASFGLELDVNDSAAITDVVAAIGERAGAPIILVNNAGITRDNLLMRMKDEEWEQIISTNLNSVYRTSKACLRGMMKARFGRIVNVTSVVGMTGNPGQANYAAAKAGMIGFTKSLAREVGSRGITVNAVAPGFIDTDMTNELPDEQKSALLKSIPLGRLGSSDEIARAVAFLVSQDAGYITGETLHVNGGMYMP